MHWIPSISNYAVHPPPIIQILVCIYHRLVGGVHLESITVEIYLNFIDRQYSPIAYYSLAVILGIDIVAKVFSSAFNSIRAGIYLVLDFGAVITSWKKILKKISTECIKLNILHYSLFWFIIFFSFMLRAKYVCLHLHGRIAQVGRMRLVIFFPSAFNINPFSHVRDLVVMKFGVALRYYIYDQSWALFNNLTATIPLR